MMIYLKAAIIATVAGLAFVVPMLVATVLFGLLVVWSVWVLS